MRKLILFIIILSALCIVVPNSSATVYYANACNAKNIDTSDGCAWNTTATGSCTASGGTALTWANRVAGDVLVANGCAGIIINVDPGIGGALLVLNNCQASACGNSAAATAGGQFTCATATGAATITASITAGSSTTPTVAISGSSGGNCVLTGAFVLTGGSAATANAVTDSHTVVTLTHGSSGCHLQGGSTSSTANAYLFSGATGTADLSACNSFGGTGAAGFNVSGNGTGKIKNCIGSDTSAGLEGCRTVSSATSGITVVGSLIYGKFAAPASGKILFAPSSTASAVYVLANTSYATTDIVDANGNILGSPTLTNAFVAPAAFVSSGIGTAANVKSGIVYGPYTGTAVSGGNSGSAH